MNVILADTRAQTIRRPTPWPDIFPTLCRQTVNAELRFCANPKRALALGQAKALPEHHCHAWLAQKMLSHDRF